MKNTGFHEFFLANTVKLHQINSPADKPTSPNTHPTINSTLQLTLEIIRSRRPEVFCKKSVLNNFTKFAGKHLCLRPATLLKEDSGIGVFLLIL